MCRPGRDPIQRMGTALLCERRIGGARLALRNSISPSASVPGYFSDILRLFGSHPVDHRPAQGRAALAGVGHQWGSVGRVAVLERYERAGHDLVWVLQPVFVAAAVHGWTHIRVPS